MFFKSQNLIALLIFLFIGLIQPLQGQTLTFNVGTDSGSVGDMVDILVSADSFTSVNGYQGTFAWDSAALQFISLVNQAPGINHIFGNPGQGIIPLNRATFTWIDFSGVGQTRPNGTVTMKLTFQIKANAPVGSTPVVMNGSVTTLGYTTGSGLIPPLVNQGSVIVQACVPTANASFVFPASACQNGANPGATITGDSGGIFSVDQSASIDALTGQLDLTSTQPGLTYTITYTVGAGCPATSTQSIQILALDDASFLFADTVCSNGLNPSATITGLSGGTFTVDNGAVIDPALGILDLTSAISGTNYQVTYTTNGACPDASTNTVFVQAADDASFIFADTACINGTNPGAIITGLSGGLFSVDNGAAIDPATGILDLTTAAPNITYQITYQTQSDCPNLSTNSVFVQATDDASFSFADSVCIDAPNPGPVLTGTNGGFFSVNNGASIDPATGILDLTSTVPNIAYQITYQTQGDCPESSSQTIFVTDSVDASFLYPTSLCPGSPNPLAMITGNSGGTFSVSPAASINPVTGELDLATATVGVVYTITYALNDFCQSFSQQSIVIEDLIAPDSLILPAIMGECSATVPVPTTTDNCAGIVSGTTSDPLTYTAQGTYLVNWTFDDGNGNQTLGSQTVMVQDLTPPTVICQNISVQLNASGFATILPTQLDSGSVDSCGIMSFAVSQDSFTIADLGQNMVTLIVTDLNGNIDSCVSVVTVTDYPAPVAICQDVTVYLDSSGLALIAAQDLDSGSVIPFGPAQFSISQDSFNCGDLGTNPVMLYVGDANGRVDSCMAMVLVVDTIAPVVSCQDISITLDSTGIAVIDASMIDGGSSDNCGIASLKISQDTFTTDDIGVNIVMLTATDQGGNSETCMAEVIVEENTTSISNEVLQGLSLSVYPNPVEDMLAIKWETPWNGEVAVSTINPVGQVISSQRMTKIQPIFQTDLSMDQLPAGIYIIQMNQNGYAQYVRVVKK